MRTSFLLPIFVLLFHYSTLAQCPSGAIGVSGSGCGCLSGCNLTSFGGPNCGGGTTGNCSAGEVAMFVDILVPSGCTMTVSATVSNRSGCSASGADAGDQMKVDVSGGSKGTQTGASNATLSDSYTLVGPGTIRVSGTANRADEIITYTSISSGCVNCASALPVGLSSFSALAEDRTVRLSWITESEQNANYFLIERSADGINFEVIGGMQAVGNSSSQHTYTNFDSSPLDGISYYRLKQVDLDGEYSYSDLRSVFINTMSGGVIAPNPADEWMTLKTSDSGPVVVTDMSGKVLIDEQIKDAGTAISLTGLSDGVYLVHFQNGGKNSCERLVVRHQSHF